MFIAIILIIMGACVSVVGSMYYNTITMLRTYGSVNGYYGAYYGAMASIERGLLMSKMKYPTYEGSGGFKGEEVYGAPSNGFSGDFRKLTQGKNSMIRSINSKTRKIEGTIDTKTLRSISFIKYDPGDVNAFSGGTKSGTFGIDDGLRFTGNIVARSPNVGEIKTNRGESSDFNRFFSLKKTGYIVRGLKTTDTYGQEYRQIIDEEDPDSIPYDREGEKDFQLTGDFNFTGNACNPRPALSGELDYGYYEGCNS